MDTVTYPLERVSQVMDQYMVPVRINTVEPDAGVRQLMRDLRMVWTPTLVWYDHHGIELRREVGYLTPDAFLGVLGLVRGQAYLLHAQYAEAEEQFLRTADASMGDAGAEAFFWAGVSALRAGSRDRFMGHWTTLYERYPESRWTSRSSFIRQG